MERNKTNTDWRKFILKIILPTILAISLFIITIFAVVVPTFKKRMMERKSEMIQELTNSAWSIFAEYEREENLGLITGDEAKKQAIIRIQNLRYGVENKDYFWITDMEPKMIMHPYLPKLNGKDLSGYKDPHGKKLFVEAVKKINEKGYGYIDYMWQWKDDTSQIVPKLSYVKGFEPWGWIIGTGIYLEDVNDQISSLTNQLVNISLGITFVIALLMLFNSSQSLKIEKKRIKATNDLEESREKYKSLVEASTEGTFMILEGNFIYSNQTLLNMLGYTEDEFNKLNVFKIFSDLAVDNSGLEYFKEFIANDKTSVSFETKFKRKDNKYIDIILNISKISFVGKKGYVFIAKDYSVNKQIIEELGESKEKYKSLTNNLNIGIFRTTLGRSGKFIDVNNASVRILGFNNKEELFKTNIFEIFHDREGKKLFFNDLLKEGFVKNRYIQLTQTEGNVATISVSAIIVKDKDNKNMYCDGIVEDITKQKEIEEERENLIVQLQTSLLFLNQPIKNFVKKTISCDMDTPVIKAAGLMSRKNKDASLVVTKEGTNIGIITDADIRSRIVAKNQDLNTPVYKVMSAPLISISDNAMIYEAIMLMKHKLIKHIAVKNQTGNIYSIISNDEITLLQQHTSSYLIREIEKAESIDSIITSHKKLSGMVKSLINSGAKTKNITRIISTVADSITIQLIRLAIQELGDPPVKFAFISLGSEAREEQTLKTDQDNAIIFEDVEEDKIEQAKEYFSRFANKVNHWLNDAGYKLCEGDIMAKNPKYCQPLSVWKKYFNTWVKTSTPQSIIDIGVFLDFRCVYGDSKLTEQLKTHQNKLLENKNLFFYHLAQNIISHKAPLSFFGSIVTGDTDDHPKEFDIKKVILPLVKFARIYALKNNIIANNTLDRLHELFVRNILSSHTYQEVEQAYNYLMLMRFKHQANALSNNKEPDNYINPNKLTSIEKSMLKKIFSSISNFQTKLSFDFKGSI